MEILFHEICHQGETELKEFLKDEPDRKPDNVTYNKMHNKDFFIMAYKFNCALEWMSPITSWHDYSVGRNVQNFKLGKLESQKRNRDIGLKLANLQGGFAKMSYFREKTVFTGHFWVKKRDFRSFWGQNKLF